MNNQAFFDAIRDRLYKGSMSVQQVAGCEAILDACAGWPTNWTAYALATAYHETAFTMHPIKEYGGNAYFTRMYDVTGARPNMAKRHGNTEPGDGPKYAGRGYVQLTWKNNYRALGLKVNRDLVRSPELALRPDIAASIMRYGMQDGLFTGKKLGDYLTASKSDYEGARRIINGTDKARTIAGYALVFEAALKEAGYGKAAQGAVKPATAVQSAKAAKPAPLPLIPQPDDPGVDPAESGNKTKAADGGPWWEKSPLVRSITQLAAWIAAGGSALLAADWRVIAVLAVVGGAVAIVAIRYQARAK